MVHKWYSSDADLGPAFHVDVSPYANFEEKKLEQPQILLQAVFRIRIHMFLGLADPDRDPLVRGMDPDPSISKQK
jgi:hypothetical protein